MKWPPRDRNRLYWQSSLTNVILSQIVLGGLPVPSGGLPASGEDNTLVFRK